MQGINKGEKMLHLKIDVIKFILSVEYGFRALYFGPHR